MESRKYDRRLPHRGAADDQAKFATGFLKGRLAGFEKGYADLPNGYSFGGSIRVNPRVFPSTWDVLRDVGISRWPVLRSDRPVGETRGNCLRQVSASTRIRSRGDSSSIRCVPKRYSSPWNSVGGLDRSTSWKGKVQAHVEGQRRLRPPCTRSHCKPRPDHQRLAVAMSLYASRAYSSWASVARHSRLC
jgi:hypothetical protein